MIAKMNKFSLLIYHKEYEGFLEKLRDLGVVHVEIHTNGEVDDSLQALLRKHSYYKNLLKEVTALDTAPAKAGSLPQSDLSAEAVDEQFEALKEHLQKLSAQRASLEKEIAQMEIWGEFDWKRVEALAENGYFIHFFACPERNFDEAWVDAYNAMVIHRKGGQCYFITVGKEPVVSVEAEAVRLPQASLSGLQDACLAVKGEIEQEEARLARFCASNKSVLESALIRLEEEIDLLKVKFGGEKKAAGALILLEGWAPEDSSDAVCALLDQEGVYYDMRPAGLEDDAPIKLKNNFVTRGFEALTKMYGMPDYGEFDPTPLLAPFYALFFGLCLGDAGYGVFLVLLGLYLKKKVSPSMAGMMNLLITLGVAATLVGALVGTFFGVELVKLDLPESVKRWMIVGKFGDTSYDMTMAFALMVGMVHLCFAMTVKAVCQTVRYGFIHSLSAWGWLLLVGGSVASATLHYLGVIPLDVFQLSLMVIGGVSAIGIYLLNNIRRNVFMNIGAGLWDTYNMATGLLGDLLSYLRLYALGLAGGMLGGVFNSLGMQLRDSMADVLWGIPGWICFGLIFVFGHTLNMALSCLSAYVHSIRLTFVEYFKNSGYDGRGTMYKPFSSVEKSNK